MKGKREFISKRADRKLRRTDHLLRVLILGMSLIVLYDSIIHGTPLYYICFYLLGMYAGRIFLLTQKVELDQEKETFVLSKNWFHIILIILLLIFRFVVGIHWMELLHVVWASDALYLFFIGLYRARWKDLVRQIDELIYGRLGS